MLLCDECNAEVENGHICPKCQRIVCSKCVTGQGCTICSDPLVNFDTKYERKNGYTVQWICFAEGKEFGLVRSGSFPAIAYHLIELLPLSSGDYKFVLFQSSKISRNFARHQDNNKKDMIVGSTEGTTIKGSKYSLLVEPTNEAYVLLNSRLTTESEAIFLVRFFNGLFRYLRSTSVDNFDHAEIVSAKLVVCLCQYNRKFGVEYVLVTPFLREWSLDIFVKLRIAYFEQAVLRNLATSESLGGEILEYVSSKIHRIFMATRELNSFNDVMNLAGSYISALSILTSLVNNQKLFSIAKNKFDREDSKIKKRMRKHEDAIEAVEELKKAMMSTPTNSNFSDFLEGTCASLQRFFITVKPTYVWLGGAEPLAEASKTYLNEIQNNSLAIHPQFGDIDTFLMLLSSIFDQPDSNPDIYPEPAIECGTLLLELLIALVRFEKNELHFQRALEVGKKLSSLIEKNADIIKKKNPRSLLDHVQAASFLMELGTMCTNFRKWEITITLLDEAIEIAQKNDLTQIKLRAYWTKFLLTQDYEQLIQVYKLHLKVPKEEPDYKFPTVMALLVSGIFEEKNRINNFREAADLSLTLTIEEQPYLTATDFLDYLFAQRLSYYLCSLFLHVAKAEMEKDPKLMLTHLLKAKPFACALEAEANMPMASENVFSWKTIALIGILTNDIPRINQSIKKLEQFPCQSKTNEYFLTKARIFQQNGNSWMNKIESIEAPTEDRDIWSRLLEKIVKAKFKDPLIERLKKASRAVLFVEGPTEEEVLPIIAGKLKLNLNDSGIALFPLIGASKARSKIRFWKEFNKRASVPLFMLVDLDGLTYAEQAIDQGLIKRENTFILSKGTIEDYYPNDVLRNSIEEMCGKMPSPESMEGKRESAINSFLRKNNYHDDWKIVLGKKVAQSMTEKQIDPEIQKVLKKTVASSS